MINPQELRKNNLINFHNEDLLAVVKGIDADDLGLTVYFPYNEGEEWVECDQFSPIPLTEYWLLRMGFSIGYGVFKNGLYRDTFGDKVLLIEKPILYSNHAVLVKIDGGKKLVLTVCETLGYVHQLQNLFFALTGQELEIKNT